MEGYLKKTLGLKKLVSLGACGGGCISDAKAYDTDIGHADDERGIGEFECH
jgi:hypothetical protein